jgi:hypothetical protein
MRPERTHVPELQQDDIIHRIASALSPFNKMSPKRIIKVKHKFIDLIYLKLI